jgi:dTDP-4-dehydrorhamnose reductase
VNDITMSPTSTSDAARAIMDLLQKNAGNGIYHVVNSGAATWYEFARQIIEEAGMAAKVTPVTSGEYSTAAVRPVCTVLNNQKAAQIVGEIRHWKHALRQYLMEKGHLRSSHARSLAAGPSPM